jgi:transposase-like protein
VTEQQTSRGGGRRRKKFLTAEQKYELWTALVRGDATQRDLAERFGVDRTTVVKVARVAKAAALSALAASGPGGAVDPRADELRAAEAEIAQLTDVVKEQAIELAVLRGKQRGAW